MSDSSDSGSSKPKNGSFKKRPKSFVKRRQTEDGASSERRPKKSFGEGRSKAFSKSGDKPPGAFKGPRKSKDGKDRPFRENRSEGDKPSRERRPEGDRRSRDRRPDGNKRPFNRQGRPNDRSRSNDRFRAERQNQELVLTPTHWGSQGEAILETTTEEGRARRTIVWRGVPDETVKVRLVREGQNQRYTEVLSVEGKAAKGRREPRCDKMDACGGCPMMHLSPKAQHAAKLSIVRSLFEDEGVERHAPTQIIEAKSAQEWNYRHTLKVAVDTTQEGHLRLGVRGRRGHVVPIPKCHVVTPLLRKVLKAVAFHVTGKSDQVMRKVMAYGQDSENPTVGLRYVVMRQSSGEKPEVQLCFVVGKYSALYRDVADAVMRQCPEVVSVSLHINRSPGNAIFLRAQEEPEKFISIEGEEREERYPNGSFARLTGRETIEEQVGGLSYQIGAGDFFQVNPVVAKQLQDAVLKASDEYQGHAVVDLYCGVGLLTLPLAKKHGWAIGVEGGEGATARAQSNARLNRVNADFSAGDVGESLAAVRRRLAGRTPIVVVDPARRGLEDGVLEQIMELNPLKIIYVSCGPRALAQDIRDLLYLNWTVESIEAYDMFPHTAHVELVAVFRPPHVVPSKLQGPRRHLIRK